MEALAKDIKECGCMLYYKYSSLLLRGIIVPVYNKLVRDKIPEIIRRDNKSCTTKILDEKNYKIELRKKLTEELEEYLLAESDSEAIEELADMIEIIHSLAKIHQSDIDHVEEIRLKKAQERGGFERRIFLIEVED